MVKLGVNTVLFKAHTLAEAAAAIKKSGYDGMEFSAIEGMCEHLKLDSWKEQKTEIKSILDDTGLLPLSTEVASMDKERLLKAFEACAELGIPIVNIGPGGTANDEASLQESIEKIRVLCELAEPFGVSLCVKAHVGNAVHDTPSTLKLMEAIKSPAFGVDMDPSHVYRAGELPEKALPSVISRVKHIHIRDCKGPGPGPGEPETQACGRGDINLYDYFKAMVSANYSGPVCLEVIGRDLDLASASIIAAESYGYMNACLKMLSK